MKTHLKTEDVCGIVQDLLPLFIEQECTPQSHSLVAEHLQECHACRSLHEQMIQELEDSESDSSLGELDDSNRRSAFTTFSSDRQAVKIIKRLRRRQLVWILLIVAILLPVGWLGIGEMTGEGMSLRNTYDHYQVSRFLGELERENYEAAFQYFNLEQQYADLQHDLAEGKWLNDAQRAVYEGMSYESFVAYSKERFTRAMTEYAQLGYRIERAGGIWASRDTYKSPSTGKNELVYSYQMPLRVKDKDGGQQMLQMALHTYPDSNAPHTFLIGGYIGSEEGELIGVLARHMDYWFWGE